MNIAIFFIARSKSTMIHDILAKKFNLEPLKEILFFSRRRRQDYEEYPELIDQINEKDNICVKICVNDFIDSKKCCIMDDYKKIDYTKFDHIIFLKREDIMGQVASFGHHNQKHFADFEKSHRKKGQEFPGFEYEIDLERTAYIIRGHRMLKEMRDWVAKNCGSAKLYDYKFETAEQQLIEDFGLESQDFDIDIEACGLDYKTLASNYQEVERILPDLYSTIMNSDAKNFGDPKSDFWKHNVSFI
jgi:hypothetical protein